MITHHVIYHISAIKKIGCSKNFEERKKAYPKYTIFEILEELHDKTDQEAGDREQWWRRQLGYNKDLHYTITVRNNTAPGAFSNRTPEQRIASGRKGGKRASELGVGVHGLSPEERILNAKKASLKAAEVTTPEQLSKWGKEGGSLGGLKGGPATVKLRVGVHSLTSEQHSLNGKIGGPLGGQLALELGVGIHSLTSEQHRENSRKGHIRSAELRVGIFAISPEQRLINGNKGGLVGGCQKRGICPYCNHETNLPNLVQYHLDNCKQKPKLRIRRPNASSLPKLIQIRGASGAGKSWCVRQILERFPPKEEYYGADGRRIEGLLLSSPAPTVVLGFYPSVGTGGADRLGGRETIMEIASRHLNQNRNVILEGLRISGSHSPWIDYMSIQKADYRFILLQTSTEQCLANVSQRREVVDNNRSVDYLRTGIADYNKRMERQFKHFRTVGANVYQMTTTEAVMEITKWLSS